MLSRRQARRLALQILFANDFLNEDISTIAQRVADSMAIEISDFAKDIVISTTAHKLELNDLIQKHLINWDLERVARLDKVLLQMSVNEMLYFPEIPAEVTINEAVELSKEFSNSKSRRFINGILDSIYKDIQNNLIKSRIKASK